MARNRGVAPAWLAAVVLLACPGDDDGSARDSGTADAGGDAAPGDTQASLAVDPAPCDVPFGEPTCATTARWSTTGQSSPAVVLVADGTILACEPSNAAGSASVTVGESDVALELRAADACDPADGSGALLAQATARASFPTPICSLTGEPFVAPAEDFVGVITFELYPALGTIEQTARRLEQAHVKHVRTAVHWGMVEPERGAFDVTARDAVVNVLASHGLRPIVTLGYTPDWAASAPAGADPRIVGQYPPREEELPSYDAYVRAVVQHYGGAIDDWQVWNEPDYSFKIDGPAEDRPTQWLELVRRTIAIVREEDPGAVIWGPDAVIAHEPPAQSFILPSLGEDLFDRFSIHTFAPTVEEMVDQLRATRELVDAHRPGWPISITAAQIIAPEPRPLCPYVGVTELDQARTLTDIYACLGNAGAAHVSWYKSTDRIMDGCIDPVTNPDGLELSGVLGPHPLGRDGQYGGVCVFDPEVDCSDLEHRVKPALWALQALGQQAP